MKPFLSFVLFVCVIFSCRSADRSTDATLDLSENVEKCIDVVGTLKNAQKQCKQFLLRYANEDVGIYEGGYYCAFGIYRAFNDFFY